MAGLGSASLGSARLCWTGPLGLARLCWARLDSAELAARGLGCAGLGSAGISSVRLGSVGTKSGIWFILARLSLELVLLGQTRTSRDRLDLVGLAMARLHWAGRDSAEFGQAMVGSAALG